VASFRENEALVVVKNRGELLSKLRFLHQNPEKATQLGQRAAATVARNIGASQRTFDAVRPLIDELNLRRR
jgi:3-deoxy-D-manno-octulosonic-acid transferase